MGTSDQNILIVTVIKGSSLFISAESNGQVLRFPLLLDSSAFY